MADEEPGAEGAAFGVYDHIGMMVEQMAHLSWQKLGLQRDTMTGKIEQNLPEAKVAVDLTAHLVEILGPKLDDEDRRRVQNLLRDLRINFLQRNMEVEG